MEPIRVKILREGARLPAYGSAEAAGADLYACLDAPVVIEPGKTAFDMFAVVYRQQRSGIASLG